MAKGKPLSAAHKAAISRGLKAYWSKRKGQGSEATVRRSDDTVQTDTGTRITRDNAAAIMFGSNWRGAGKKKRATKTGGRRRRR